MVSESRPPRLKIRSQTKGVSNFIRIRIPEKNDDITIPNMQAIRAFPGLRDALSASYI
jgi:hypothetical protein